MLCFFNRKTRRCKMSFECYFLSWDPPTPVTIFFHIPQVVLFCIFPGVKCRHELTRNWKLEILPCCFTRGCAIAFKYLWRGKYAIQILKYQEKFIIYMNLVTKLIPQSTAFPFEFRGLSMDFLKVPVLRWILLPLSSPYSDDGGRRFLHNVGTFDTVSYPSSVK